MNLDASVITGALTAAGALPAGYLIQFIIQLLKGVPQLASVLAGREKLICLFGAYVIVIAAYAIALTSVPPTMDGLSVLGLVAGVLAGLNIARNAMSAYDDFVAKDAGKRPTESVLNAKGWTGPAKTPAAPPAAPKPRAARKPRATPEPKP